MRSHCLVTSEFAGLHLCGGIGTHTLYLARFLRSRGDKVLVLYLREATDQETARWREALAVEGIELVTYGEALKECGAGNSASSYWLKMSEVAAHWLMQHQFDGVHFQEMLGQGYSTLRLKRFGIGFHTTRISVTMHSSWEWVDEMMHRLPRGTLDDRLVKHMERYSVENADEVYSVSAYMVQWVKSRNWKLRRDPKVVPLLLEELPKSGLRSVHSAHLIFFGRLETRKGILIYIDALRSILRTRPASSPKLHLTFLGAKAEVAGADPLGLIWHLWNDHKDVCEIELLNDFDHHAAVTYLSDNRGALVVVPSLTDNSPYAVLECIVMQLDVIASQRGGIVEMFGDKARLFEPNPESLSRKIEAWLDGSLPKGNPVYTIERSRRAWEHEFASWEPTSPRNRPVGAHSKVHVVTRAGGFGVQSVDQIQCILADLERKQRPLLNDFEWPEFYNRCAEGADAEWFVFLHPACTLSAEKWPKLLEILSFTELDAFSDSSSVDSKDDTPRCSCFESSMLRPVGVSGLLAVRRSKFEKLGMFLEGVSYLTAVWRFTNQLFAEGARFDVAPLSIAFILHEEGGSISDHDDALRDRRIAIDPVLESAPASIRRFLLNISASDLNSARNIEEAKRKIKSA